MSVGSVTSLYQGLLGVAWARLDERVAAMHAADGVAATGRFTITHGANPAARMLGRLARLPGAGLDVPVTLEVSRRGTDGELWQRNFGGVALVTQQKAVDGCLAEGFGHLWLLFQLMLVDGALIYRQVRAWLQCGPVRLPLPRWLAPRITAREWAGGAGEDVTRVLVQVALPVLGPLITYQGEIACRRTRGHG